MVSPPPAPSASRWVLGRDSRVGGLGRLFWAFSLALFLFLSLSLSRSLSPSSQILFLVFFTFRRAEKALPSFAALQHRLKKEKEAEPGRKRYLNF